MIEDDDAIRAAVTDALHLEGYEVESAANGALALESVKGSRPDAIVLDLMMPVMDGWAFLEACRGSGLCQGVPVVVTSAYRDLAEIASQLRVQACLAKPFDLDVLLGAVERLVARSPGQRSTAAGQP